ncbi:MAG: hypothetical protein LQ345_006430 [Seirophora villosa]|nr:MAG: hypothetical protein LQ345_006430 [Seirophora villosa]
MSADPASKRKSRASLLDLFVSEAEIRKLRGELQLRKDRKRAPSAAASAAAATPTPAPAADTAATPAAPEAPKPAESPKPDEAAKPAEEAKPADEAAKAPWTPAEDVALLSLKGQNKSWKEIGEVLVGRDKDELRDRFKEIGGPNLSEGSGGGAAKDGAAASDGPSDGGKGGNKGKQQKGDGGGKKGKGKQEEKKDEPAVAAAAAAPAAAGPASAPAPAANPNEALVADRKDATIKGILRRGSDGAFHFGEAAVPNGATTLNGCPIIYLEENDPLNIDELSFLYNMNCAFEEQRWIRMASKFFDQTGKRIDPEWLRDKLRNCM